MSLIKLPRRQEHDGNPGDLLRQALRTVDEHLLAYGHDVTWLTGRGRYGGTCAGCRGQVVVHLDGEWLPRVTASPVMVAPGTGDYAECKAIPRQWRFGSRRRLAAEGAR